MYQTVIPVAVKAAETSAAGQSIYSYDKNGVAAKAYGAFTREEALAEEQAALDIRDSRNLTNEQKKAVDRAIIAYNECGAAYGAAAYRFGMEDGIKVRMEMEEIMRMI